MLRRKLYEDDLYILTAGLLGGVSIVCKQYNSTLTIPKPIAQFFHRIVKDYSSMGGDVSSHAPAFARLCEEFVWSMYPDVNGIKAKVYLQDSPRSIAERTLSESGSPT